jgi:glycosyltransferase involved in cell wall biosynthesis
VTQLTKLSIVIPLLNEESLVKELIKQVTINAEKITNYFEIIIVDDGSVDNTWENIAKEKEHQPKVTGIKLSKNFGHHYAITAGIHKSCGDWVIVMDGDLQDRPEVIPELFKKASEGFEVVFVSRMNRPESKIYLFWQKVFYILLNRLSGLDMDSSQANYSIISRKVANEFCKFSEYSRFYSSTIKWLGFNRSHVPASHGSRHSGKPSYTIKRRIKLASEIIFSFSDRPLKAMINVGLILCVAQLLLTLIIFMRSITSEKLLEMNLVYLMGSFSLTILLLLLSTVSIYVSRINTEVKKRPLYIVEKII